MTSYSDPNDVPSPIDFHDLAQARAWVERTLQARPWRPRFFQAFADALNAEERVSHQVVELGSGPGHLAAVLLEQCRIERYVALDFSPAMHLLAREHLGALATRVTFTVQDFRSAECFARLEPADVIVTHQAAHEVRHKDRQAALFQNVRAALRPGGLFLICYHYWEPDVSWKEVPLYLTKEEQIFTLAQAEFTPLKVLHDEGGMRLISARRV